MGCEGVSVDDFDGGDVYLEGLRQILVEFAVYEYFGFVLFEGGEYLLY